jgi:tetratricopeptide (TPR) repeat protein
MQSDRPVQNDFEQKTLPFALSRYAAEQYDDALRIAVQLDESVPGNTEILNFAGACAYKLGLRAIAEEYWRRAIEQSPDSADVANNLGVVLQDTSRFDAAERMFRRALDTYSEHMDATRNLGRLLYQFKCFPEAEVLFRRLIAHCASPDERAFEDLGHLLTDLKRPLEAEVIFRRGIEIHPGSARLRFSLSLLLLRLGRWREAWPYFEARSDASFGGSLAKAPLVPFPQWQGEPIQGKSLLIWFEQGFGDQIQIIRYVPILKALGVRRITVVCQPPLRSLFESIAGADAVITPEFLFKRLDHDYWTYIFSLPINLGATLETIPVKFPYLRAPKERIRSWKTRLPRTGLKVGLVWKGGTANPRDPNRSLPNLTALAPLWRASGVTFVSLQKGQGEAEAADAPPGQSILNLGSQIQDFADAAAIITQLDLVISVDTAMAHLAGALGKSCWVLLPGTQTDWRWMDVRTDSPWYPGIVKLFRQDVNALDWTDVIEEVTLCLMEFQSRRTERPESRRGAGR